MPFLINRKISSVRIAGFNGREILYIIIFIDSNLEIIDDIFIFFLKYLSENSVFLLTGLVVFPIMINFINKKEREDFDAFME